ncbi:unnamed protein product, partial [Darwinula stevensoni]
MCVMQIPSPCYAFNYRETDRSCQLILNGMSRLVEAKGFQSYVQMLCLREHPPIENAVVSFVGWSGEYPAPARAIVTFRCDHPKGFSDGARIHKAECATFNPDSWHISFKPGEVQCEKVHTYPECRRTEKGRENVGRVSVTESGRNCLDWRDYPYGRPDDFAVDVTLDYEVEVGRHGTYETYSELPGLPARDVYYEVNFLNMDSWSHHNYCRNPSERERLWCFVSDPKIQWEYCDIPMCTDTVPPECKVTQQGGEYMGRKDFTIAGFQCLPWRNREVVEIFLLAFPDPDRVDGHHNFCRNPNMQMTLWNYYESNVAHWCFLESGKDSSWGFCDIPFCDLRAQEDELRFSDEVDGKHAYCRNPGYHEFGPWCYIGQDDEWEYCDVPYCPILDTCDIRFEGHCFSPLECKTNISGLSYIGTENVTRNGHKCLPWMTLSVWRQVSFQEQDNYDPEGAFDFWYDLLRKIQDDLHPQHNFCRNPVHDEN